MANYYASARSSYAKMKDDDDFLSWAETIPDSEVIKLEDEEHGTLYGFLFGTDGDSGAIPNIRYVDDKDYDLDVHTEIQAHLAEGWSIIFMEVGAEKLRYVSGHAAVITPTEMEFVNLGSWAEEALKKLGSPKSTACEY